VIALLNKRNFQGGFFILIYFMFVALAAFTEETLILIIPIGFILVYMGWTQIPFVFYVLLFLLPFSAEYNLSDILSIDLPDEPLIILLAIFIIAYWLYHPGIFSGIFGHPIFLSLLLFFSWTIITVIFSAEPLLSIKYLLAKSWYILAFVFTPFIVFLNTASIRKGVRIFLVSMIGIVLLIIVRHAILGFTFSSMNEAVSPFFRNHVNYSAMLVCTMPVLFAGYSMSKRDKRMLWVILMGLFLVAVFFSYSRGAWLALVGGLIVYWLINKKLLVATYLIAILAGLSVFVWLNSNDNYLKFAPNYNKTIFHSDFEQHILATYQLKDISTAERFYRWVAGVRMIKDKGLTGFGPNSFYDHYKEYTLPAFKTWVSGNPERSTVHNYFLLLAIEQGIPGLILFLILVGILLYYSQHLYHRIKDHFYRRIAITVGVILTMIMLLNFLSDLIETDKIGSLFFLSISILVITDLKTRNELDPSPDIEGIS
jgi:O-antigen ligase